MSERKKVFKGRAWLLRGDDGGLIDDIDTDMIFHNAYLHIVELSQMGQYALDNLEGYNDFAKRSRPTDMVIAGANFGSGSSRQQAVDCFLSLGISCLICRSYGAIYKRNAINSGFPVFEISKLDTGNDGTKGSIEHLDVIEVDMVDAKIRAHGKVVGALKAPSRVQLDIYEAGNIFEYAKRS